MAPLAQFQIAENAVKRTSILPFSLGDQTRSNCKTKLERLACGTTPWNDAKGNVKPKALEPR